MNDRFKFRVWDKEQNKYLPLVSRGDNLDFWISLDNTGVYLVERDNNRDIAYFSDITENVIVQFCTGLKDKNGKLIYEGDVVKMPFVEPILNYMPSNENTEFAKIEEFKGCFTIFYLDKSQRTYLYQWNNRIEVIGNIYENKELLESEEE